MTDLILCTLRRCEHEPIHMNEDCARSKQHLATEDFCSSVGANPSIVEVAHRFTLGFYLFGGVRYPVHLMHLIAPNALNAPNALFLEWTLALAATPCT